MAKLYFRYSAMNSGKTTSLIQVAYNYEERHMKVVIIKPAIDTKGNNKIISRIGLKRTADIMLKPGESALEALEPFGKRHCVLVDEAQFLEPNQVDELFWYAVDMKTPVMAFGLRTDFKMIGFPGATRLLEVAHDIQEIKTICRCGRKAILNGRKVNGEFVSEGEQVAIDGKHNVDYESLCAVCYRRFVSPIK